jgi:hypothetical protein
MAGQIRARSTAFWVAQLSAFQLGLPNSWRMAAAVADMGFQVAMVPSQPGIVSGDTKALERNPTGQGKDLDGDGALGSPEQLVCPAPRRRGGEVERW